MKYTRDNLRDICIKHLNKLHVESVGIDAGVKLVAVDMFVKQYPEDEDSEMVRRAISNLNIAGYFNFEPE